MIKIINIFSSMKYYNSKLFFFETFYNIFETHFQGKLEMFT